MKLLRSLKSKLRPRLSSFPEIRPRALRKKIHFFLHVGSELEEKNGFLASKTHFFLHGGSGLVEKFGKQNFCPQNKFLHVAVQGFGTVTLANKAYIKGGDGSERFCHKAPRQPVRRSFNTGLS